jgi:uncharacterized protein
VIDGAEQATGAKRDDEDSQATIPEGTPKPSPSTLAADATAPGLDRASAHPLAPIVGASPMFDQPFPTAQMPGPGPSPEAASGFQPGYGYRAEPPPPASPPLNMGGGGPPGWAPFWCGDRLVDPRVSDTDRMLAVIAHLWWVAFFIGLGPLAIFVPVVLWAIRQSTSGFVDDHGREVVNMQLTGLILAISIVGIPLLPIWAVVTIVNSIRGAVAAGSREHFRYGMILRPIG